jgi:dTDP-4-dehydrorhamnose reductase
MLRLGAENGRVSVVNDQVFSPTNTEDLSSMIVRLIHADATGLFHVTNSGACSWYDFATRIFELAGRPVEVNPISTARSGSTVSRPRFSVLENRRLQDEGFGLLRSWDDALASYLTKRAATLAAVGSDGHVTPGSIV